MALGQAFMLCLGVSITLNVRTQPEPPSRSIRSLPDVRAARSSLKPAGERLWVGVVGSAKISCSIRLSGKKPHTATTKDVQQIHTEGDRREKNWRVGHTRSETES